jgi:thioredoxin reductase (NADPH)
MTDPSPDTPHDDAAFARLEPAALDRLAAYGHERDVAVGELLFPPGDAAPPLFAVRAGRVDVVHIEDGGEDVIARHGPGAFTGELGLLSGAHAQLTARVGEAGRLIEVAPEALRELLDSEADLARTIVDALLARRAIMERGGGARTLRILGSRYAAETLDLRRYVTRMRLPHVWEDLDEHADVDAALERLGLAPGDTPVVVTPNGVLRQPTPEALAEHLGLTATALAGEPVDLVVVGAGPAGLATAVYGASEGIETLVVDGAGPGGQAGSSALIENYLGFPSGVSGRELTDRAAAQALKFGARITSPCEVAQLEPGEVVHVLRLGDGTELLARTVVVATGAHYRRPDIPTWTRFEGRGIHYAATDLEARTCDERPVVVLGGGNSAGQAALFLAGNVSAVELVVRSETLEASMSRYLVGRIEAHERITVRTGTVVQALRGEERLEEVELESALGRTVVPCSALFAFIGAEAATAWLPDSIELDRHGFVLTDRDLVDRARRGAVTLRHRPLPFETSVAGIFAVGDVRHGSSKRVAAAVGEGSSAVRSIHRRLAAHADVAP